MRIMARLRSFVNQWRNKTMEKSQKKTVRLEEACEWLKNTIYDDVLVKCGSVIKCMGVDEFVSYFNKSMEK